MRHKYISVKRPTGTSPLALQDQGGDLTEIKMSKTLDLEAKRHNIITVKPRSGK